MYVAAGEKFDNFMSLGVGLTCRLCSTPYVLARLPRVHKCTKFVTQTHHAQSLQQEVSHIDVWRQIWQIHAYFENYLVLELKHHSLHINSIIIFMPWRTKVMEIFQLRHTLVGGTVETIFFPRRQASRLYMFFIQCPIHTKLLISVKAVSMNTSQHQDYVGHFDCDRLFKILPYIMLSHLPSTDWTPQISQSLNILNILLGLSWLDAQKAHLDPYSQSNWMSAILMCGGIFWQIHAYFENYLVLKLKHHSLHIHSVSS